MHLDGPRKNGHGVHLATERGASRYITGSVQMHPKKSLRLPEKRAGARALTALGRQELDAEVVEQTLGSVLKYHEDLLVVRDVALQELVDEARGAR